MTRTGAVPAPVRAKAVGFLRLGKARIYHHEYSWLLAVLLLRLDGHLGGRIAPVLLLLLAVVLLQWSGGAADDLGGFRDGSDARNYAGRPPRTRAKKPLVTGVLSESEAVVFGVVCWVGSVVAGLLAVVLVDGPVPWAAVALLLVTQVAAVQYSTGLKTSYRPLGLELSIFGILGGLALTPYWIVAGGVTAEALLVSALFGLWFLMVVCHGNASDRRGDAAVSRRTLAVLLPPRGYDVVLCLLPVAGLALLTALFTTTRIDTALAVAVVPVVVVQAVQLHAGVRRRDWRRARFLGLVALDLGCLGLAAAIALS
ncbi:prenyltransferase [Saccharothrix sp. NPDC042600]|uniref:prenyltransferase n=1 Tax=Saccharothrix TaxID=2071 RepID=UPI0033E96DF9|nr:hypothetical protein GCM10017745_58200 [Saccharothrix mutabilis subsp. capreolus]